MKAKYLRVAAILEYVCTFLYALTTALFYSVSNNLFWMFLVFGIISLCLGLYSESIINRLQKENKLNKVDFIVLIVITVISVIDCVPLLFNLLALLSKKESPVKVVFNENYQKEEKKQRKWFLEPCFLVTCISLLSIVASSVSGSLFESNGGKVEVKDGTITKKESDEYLKDQTLFNANYTITDPKVSISYTMYRPKEATATNQLPVVFVVPGFTRTKATMAQYAIELSRRGAVVFTIDPGSQGATTHGGYQWDDTLNDGKGGYVLDANGNKIQNGYSVARSGMGYLLPYVYNNIDDFDFIDRDRIGLMGHSAGGGDACKLADDLAGDNYDQSIVKALYISGYIKTSAANVFYKLRCNAALSYAKYDEGSFRYQDENQAYEVIALRFINEVNSKTSGANGKFEDFIQDYDYGNFDTGTYRIIHHEDINHCFEMYDPTSISNTTNFFRRSLKLNTEIADSHQTWFGKELSNGLALIFAFMLIISLTSVVIKFVPFMKSLAKEAEERKENEQEFVKEYSNDPIIRQEAGTEKKNKSFAKRLLFWLPMVLTGIIACLDYIPLARLSMDLFEQAAGNIYTYYFPARMMNAVFLWAVVNGAIGIFIWVFTTLIENLYFLIRGKKDQIDWSKFKGLKVKPLNLLKSLGLAVVLFFTFYGVLQLVYITTHQDFRFMLVSASPLQPRFIVTWLIYLAGFYVFYFSNSIRVNLGIAREGFKEWQVITIGALANSLGLVFMIIINYFVYFKTGTVYYGYYSSTDTNEMWLYINMVFPLIVMMFILPIFNRLSYRKMGNVYSGALLWCMIFIMMSLSASISFIPM